VLYLLKGRLEHVIGDETFLMSAGDTTVVPAGVSHVAYSTGEEDAEMIVAYPTGSR
jgi:mannose-6-phosphate isomerase-like protein (cupin superfamily)